MKKRIDRRTGLFLLISFGFSWLVALGIYMSIGFQSAGSWLTVLLLLYMCGPGLAGVVCAFVFDSDRKLAALGLHQPVWREMPWAWIGPVLILVAALLFTVMVPGYSLGDPIAANIAIIEALPEETMPAGQRDLTIQTLQMDFMPFVLGFSALIIGPLINWPLMLSEELGWRGYLWDRLAPTGFWSATLMTGALWGVWHAPIIWLGHNYPGMPIIGSALFVLFCMLFAPLYSWLRVTTRSVWGPALAHGVTNGAAGYFLLLQDPMDMPWMGALGAGGIIALAISTGLIALFWKKKGAQFMPALD